MSSSNTVHQTKLQPGAREIGAAIPAETKVRSTVVAVALFAFVGGIYGGTFVGMLVAKSLWLTVALALLNSVGICLLFVIGHDACHGSFTNQNWLNQIIGRVAFLPPLYPFTSWEVGHNRLHHCWTNLRSRDYAWAPHSLSEYRAMPVHRRWLERVYRHPLGMGIYSIIEIWWLHMMWPDRRDLANMPRWLCVVDRLLVLAGLVIQTTLLCRFAGERSQWAMVCVGLALPLAIFGWLFGVVTYLQHTHPRTRWFDKAREWNFFMGQVENTVHVIFPKLINAALLFVMEHTAHHIDPEVPLYQLPEAQAAVRERFKESIITVRFSVLGLFSICRTCQLYDYEVHCWMSFAGSPTTAPPTLLAHHAPSLHHQPIDSEGTCQ